MWAPFSFSHLLQHLPLVMSTLGSFLNFRESLLNLSCYSFKIASFIALILSSSDSEFSELLELELFLPSFFCFFTFLGFSLSFFILAACLGKTCYVSCMPPTALS